MANVPLILLTVSMWIVLLIHSVSIGSPNWLHITYSKEKIHAGLFQACYSFSSVSFCSNSFTASSSHAILSLFEIAAGVLYFVTAIIVSANVRREQMLKSTLRGIGITTTTGCACGIIGLIMFASTYQSFISLADSMTNIESGFDYSFFLCVLSTIGAGLSAGIIWALTNSAPRTRRQPMVVQNQSPMVVFSPNQGVNFGPQGGVMFPPPYSQTGTSPEPVYAQPGVTPPTMYIPPSCPSQNVYTEVGTLPITTQSTTGYASPHAQSPPPYEEKAKIDKY